MKFLIVALCVVGCAYAALEDAQAEVVNSNYNLDPTGNFQYGYDGSNGIHSSAQGVVKPVDKEHAVLSVQGSSSYKSPDGETIEITYVADENGYQPQGSHIPTPPPVPEVIARALEYIRAHPYVEEKRQKRNVPRQVYGTLAG